jgi:hypothetical protein
VNDGAEREPDMTLRVRGIASVMSLGFLITLTSAQQSTREPAASGVDIFNYGEVDKTCMRWTDSCRNCSRGTGSFPICGNIGIACQPRDKVTCFDRAPEQPKPEETKSEETKPEETKQ